MALDCRASATQMLPTSRAVELDVADAKPRWLVQDLWAESGVGLIGGTPKSLKTWVGLELAVSVATGTRCFDQYPVGIAGPALVYLAEDRLCMVRERLDALCLRRSVSLDALDVHVITVPSLRLDRETDLQRLDVTVAQLAPRFLLLDPFVRLSRADENNAQEVAAILAALRDMQRRHDVAVAIAHHTRKNGRAAQHGQTLRGSGDFHAWSDSALYLVHVKDALRVTVEHRSAPAPSPFRLQLTGQPPKLTMLPDIVTDIPKPLEERVVRALQASDSPLRRAALRTSLAVNNNKLGEVLVRLERSGRIRRMSSGWTL